MLKVLVADDDEGLRVSLATYLKDMGYDVAQAVDGVEAVEFLEKGNFDIALLDVDMPRMDGLKVLKHIKIKCPSTLVIMLTAYSNVPDAVVAMKDGAYNYLSKPVSFESLQALIKRALEAKAMVQRIVYSAPLLKSQKESLNVDETKEFLAKSDRMKQIFGLITRLAKVDTAVLIRGESGTGKELVAKALHFNSLRKDAKFVAVNCSAIPENLIESEFFGHEKGSFTGAHERKIGKFQYANGGTLFLDEVGDITPLMQVKLLRVLQEKKFTPVGANREVEVDVRIVAATNRDLEQMMKEGKFREDLYYRLNVLPIFLPPLRERLEDIEIVAERFVQQFNEKHKRQIQGITPAALAVLRAWPFPGNIRELENVIEHAFVLEATNMITPQSLPPQLLVGEAAEKALSNSVDDWDSDDTELTESIDVDLVGEDEVLDLAIPQMSVKTSAATVEGVNWQEIPTNYHAFKEHMEKEFIVRALRMSGGRINQAVRESGIPKKTLLRKIVKYGIDRKNLKDEEAQPTV